MKRYIARHILMARLAALALGALCFLQATVRAQGMTGYIVIFPSVGVAAGQKLRFTLFNPNGAPVRAQAQIHYRGFNGGVVVASGDVDGGAFHSFDFKHSDIPMPGEEGTGRKQILPSVRLSFSDSEAIKPVVASMEIIDIRDGTSNTILFGEKLPSQDGGNGNDTITSGFGNDIMMGIVPGQTLRVTIFNPPASETGASVNAHVKVFSGTGDLLMQNPEIVIPPGEFRSVNINRNEIPLSGEPGTSRAQVRINTSYNPYITVDYVESARLPALQGDDRLITNVVSFEVIDNTTGKTVTLSGQQCLVFYLGGTPGN